LFPFDQIRPGQAEFYCDVREAVSEARHIVAYAPTGIGKTAASLSACLEFALSNDKTVLFLTSRQTQHKIALDTLRGIRKRGAQVRVVDMINKQSMCFRNVSARKPRQFQCYCNSLRKAKACGTSPGVEPAAELILSEVNSAHDSREICSAFEGVCPHGASLAAASSCDVLICDYSYAFAPHIQELIFTKIKKEFSDCIAIVDEAHNLPPRIREIMDRQLTKELVGAAIEETKGFKDKRITNSLKCVFRFLNSIDEGAEGKVPAGFLQQSLGERMESELLGTVSYEEFLQLLSDASHKVEEQTEEEAGGALDEDATSATPQVWAFFDSWDALEESSVRFIRNCSLHYKILDISAASASVFSSLHSSVLMSGTLYPMKMYADVLGLEPERTTLREYSSPFPPGNRKILIDTAVSSEYGESGRSEDTYRCYAGKISEVACATPGNTAVFFPSYEFLSSVSKYLSPGKPVFEEKRESSSAEKHGLIEKLGRNREKGGVLLGVFRGSFSEGMDYPGNLLSSIVIAGVPFSQPSLEGTELTKHYEKLFGKGRDYAINIPAFNHVLQAAGRAIRSERDRAVIVLLDKRFAFPHYQKFLPPEFRVRPTLRLGDEVRGFFSNGD